jgi:D-alanyl-D-alanine carboxypeptidase/D-alanyl-D-alanine-endopeptidase (penicillin-binding protein 4)
MLLVACQVNAQPKIVPKSPAPTPAPTPSPIIQLQRNIDARLAAARLDQGTWGVVVQSLANGEMLYARNSRKLLMPASAMKTLTLAVAAERLGWDFSFETRLVADGAVDEWFLNGDLVVGAGDPTLDDRDGAAIKALLYDQRRP